MATNHDKQVGLTISTQIDGQEKLEKYLKTLEKTKSAITSVTKSSNTGINAGTELNSTNKSIEELDKKTQNLGKSLESAFDIGKLMLFAKGMSKVVTTMARYSKKSMDYVENINLYQVAFNGAYEGADRFINKVSEMYGLDESQLTKSVGIFKQLTNAMNIATDTGEKLSTLLTQMSIDISSLYNVDFDRAQSVLQSALSGQTRPIRSVTGADVTMSTLQQELGNLNIDRYVNDLTYAEKRLLIVISLTKQLTQATDDFGRTIEFCSIM